MNDENQSQTIKGQFNLQRIYLKDLSFEAPNAPETFKAEWKPEIQMELNNASHQLEEDIFEVILSITVTAKNHGKVAFIVEIKQAGIFLLKQFAPNQLPVLLGSYCPNILYPYAREAVSDLVGKGSFPQLLLAPVNFDALFAEAVKRKQQEQAPPKQMSH